MVGYKRFIGVLRCLLSIPYAPIPSASGFGAGFGCLNTFSKGIWSTRVFCFFLRNQKVAASLQDTTYNDEQSDANKSWFENVVYQKKVLMDTGKTENPDTLEPFQVQLSCTMNIRNIISECFKYRSKVPKRTPSEI